MGMQQSNDGAFVIIVSKTFSAFQVDIRKRKGNIKNIKKVIIIINIKKLIGRRIPTIRQRRKSIVF